MYQEDLTETLDDKFHISADAVNADEHNHILNHSNTFGVFDRWGNIFPKGKRVQGIYHEGMRYVNQLVLTINDQKPLLLSSAIKEDNDILSIDLTNPLLKECNIAENMVHLSRHQFLRDGTFYEDIQCMYYGEKECSFTLTLTFSGDFKDIFEIRGITRTVAVNKTTYTPGKSRAVFSYDGLDGIERKAAFHFTTPVRHRLEGNQAKFLVKLTAGRPVNIRYSIDFICGKKSKSAPDYLKAKKAMQEELNKNRLLFADIISANDLFNHWINRSEIDLISLLAETSEGKYPYAGVPWYNTPFGRDGLITAMECLWLAPEISKQVLLFLAKEQATALIPEKDAEPGKILHEARSSEMANTGEVPFKQYYGTVDATPLFIMLAGMYYERTADLKLIKEIWPNIKAALLWIDTYGDIDGDGFVEYQYKAKNGLTNQGWKDSFDAIMYADGQLAQPPIALCEVQGYVYGAKRHAAKLAKALRNEALSIKLSAEAEKLKKQFNEKFWDEQLGCFVLALDGNKNPCRVISSNAGQCLFTGIADNDKAKKLADVLLSSKMFSGWGIRTLSATEKKFNPMSYHNGSVWPHDNALIAFGLARYGFKEHVLKVMEALYEASLYIELQRLPELFCGFKRRPNEGPTAYPVACSPQAWSVAVVFMLLQACFRLKVDALTKTITFDKPLLPPYLRQVYIKDLRLGATYCSLNITRLENDVGFNLLQKPAGWDIIIRK